MRYQHLRIAPLWLLRFVGGLFDVCHGHTPPQKKMTQRTIWEISQGPGDGRGGLKLSDFVLRACLSRFGPICPSGFLLAFLPNSLGSF